jgi:tRNA(adenine34) deaminase
VQNELKVDCFLSYSERVVNGKSGKNMTKMIRARRYRCSIGKRPSIEMMHQKYMQLAIEQAYLAQEKDEVPVGAVLLDQANRILAVGHNETISRCDPSAHAEMLVLRRAARRIENYRLLATTLYVTVEPCVMCMGAIIHARVAQVVFGAFDPKWGAGGSMYDFADDRRFNHHPEIVSGVCREECREMMQAFFRRKR